MQIVLIQDVDGVGFRGQTVNVSPGYARNFLIPQGKALIASNAARNIAGEINRVAERKESHVRAEAQGRAERLAGVSLTMYANAGDEGKLFGSITSGDIVEELNKQVSGLSFEKQDVLLREPLKALGKYSVKVKVFRDIQPVIEVKVVAAKPKADGAASSKAPGGGEPVAVEGANDATSKED